MSRLPIPHIINTIKTKLGFDRTMTAPGEDVVDAVNKQSQQIVKLQEGIAIIVDGDTASLAVPVGGYAYIKNNTHGLAEGMYKNTSSSVFPMSGGIANNTVFTIVPTGAVNDAVSLLNSNIAELQFTMGCIYSGFDTTDGHYYTRKLTFVVKDRFPIMVLRCSQNNGYAPVGGSVRSSNGYNHVYFSDSTVTWDPDTSVITVDNGANGWAQPCIIFPKGFIT